MSVHPSDLLAEYSTAMSAQAAAEVAVTAAADRRARALAELNAQGWSFAKIAAEVGLTRARVQQLIERGRHVADADIPEDRG